MTAALRYAATLAVLGLAWALYVHWWDVPAYLLPAPGAVLATIGDLAATGRLWPHLGHTVGVLAAGLVIGTAAGFLLGFALAKAPRVERLVGPYVFFFQTAPKIALAPLFILWFGLGLTSKLVLVVSLVFFPVMVGTILGLQSVRLEYRQLAALLRVPPLIRLRRIELPAALPEIFAGLRVAAVQATIGAILAEWMAGDRGLGYLMVFGSTTYNSRLLYAMVLVTALLGIAVYHGIAAFERRALSWR